MDEKKEFSRLDLGADGYEDVGGEVDKITTNLYTVELVKKYIFGKRVLLLGIGSGVVCEMLLQIPDISLTTVEGSGEVIRRFAPDVKNVEIVHSLFEDFSPAESFDTIIGTHVLEHVEDPVNVAKKCLEWCKKGGRGIFAVPNADSPHRRIGVAMGMLSNREALNERDVKQGHRRVYRSETLRLDIERAGWVVDDIRGYMIKVLSNAQMKDLSQEYHEACYKVSLEFPPEYCVNLMAVCKNGK